MQHTIPKSLLVQRMEGKKKPHMKTILKTLEQGCATLAKAKTFKAGWWSTESEDLGFSSCEISDKRVNVSGFQFPYLKGLE